MGNPRGLGGASMRLVSPAPVLVSGGNQQGEFEFNNISCKREPFCNYDDQCCILEAIVWLY